MSEIDIEKKESGGVPWWAWLLGLLALAALIWYATAAMSGKPVTTATNGNTMMAADNSAMATDNSAMATDNGAMATDNGVMAANNGAMATDNGAMAANNGAMAANNSAMNADANAAPAMGADTNAANMSMSNSGASNAAMPAAASGEAITDILKVVDAKEPAKFYGKQVKLLGAPVQAAGTKVFWIGPSFKQKMLVVTDAKTNMNGLNKGVAQADRVDIEGTLMEIKDFKDAKAKYNLDENAITYLTNKKMLLMASSINRDKN